MKDEGSRPPPAPVHTSVPAPEPVPAPLVAPLTAPSTPLRDLRERTTAYALRVMAVCEALPRTRVGGLVANQLLRAGTSVGAQYREAFRARSKAESISKIESSLQELEESSFWLEIIARREMLKPERLAGLHREAAELTAILVTCV